MESKKILIVTNEMAPYTEINEQSQFVRDLALNLQKKGMEVRVFMPKFGPIKERKHRLHEVIRLSGLNITIGRENNPLIIKVASLQTAKIQVYFLDNDEYYQRKYYFFDGQNKFFTDNDKRVIFFNKGVMELLIKLGWSPDVVHCQGWSCSLVPAYSRTLYKMEPSVKNVKMIYSYFEDNVKQVLGEDFDQKSHLTGLLEPEFSFMGKPTCDEIYKAGVKYADGVTITSQKVSKTQESYIKESNKPFIYFKNSEPNDFYKRYIELVKTITK